MALYHTYRPQDFSSIIGQEHIAETLKNQILSGKVAHAYLFVGPRGVGKTSTARILAKAINCERKKDSADPDNTTTCAIEISEGRSIDVIEMDAASHTGVENVRENIIDAVRFHPVKLPYKVFIIDEAHMLSGGAFNALLKTLEEPPAHVLFILATTELNKLPETVVSRCQVFRFQRVAHDILASHIFDIAKKESVTVDAEVVDRIVEKSEGCVRDAVSLLDQLLAGGETHITKKTASILLPSADMEDTLLFLEALAGKDAKAAMESITGAVNQGTRPESLAEDVLHLLRMIMIQQTGAPVAGQRTDVGDAARKRLGAIGRTLGKDILPLIDCTLKRSEEIRTAPIPSLPLELLVIEWCWETIPTPPPSDEIGKIEEKMAESPKKDASTPSVAKRVTEKVKDLVHKRDVAKEEVERVWSSFLSSIETQSPSLAFVVKTAKLHGVSGHTVTLSVGYKFHQDKLMDKTVRTKFEEALETLLGAAVILSVIVDPQSNTSTTASEDTELTNLASAFGGEVV